MINTYATNVDGVPKTDFDNMRKIAGNIAYVTHDEINFRELSSVSGGKTQCMYYLDSLEECMRSVDFNAFANPEPSSLESKTLVYSVRWLACVYIVRDAVRQEGAPDIIKDTQKRMLDTFNTLINLAKKKDGEYGASWCKRGGIGAWFTTVRKFDRMHTQLAAVNYDPFCVVGDADSTESLEETIKDGINYLLLIIEKRQAIYELSQSS